ncbi:hypothetical protein [Mesorhizobium sp. A623]
MTYALFQMWGDFRQSLIRGHLFYVEQARKRLLTQFDNNEADADQAAQEWLEESGRYFDPDRHDEGSFYEAANDVRIEFYGLLSDMRENTRLSVVAGMFHEWDKQLRGWLAREIRHWHGGDIAAAKMWSVNFDQIAELLACLDWPVRTTDYFSKLDACRRVVNVYKHGKGDSLDDLKSRYPEYLPDPFEGSGRALSNMEYRDHTHLKVSDDQMQAFSDAIVSFWQNVPENIYDTQVNDLPGWFEKAIQKDRANSK